MHTNNIAFEVPAPVELNPYRFPKAPPFQEKAFLLKDSFVTPIKGVNPRAKGFLEKEGENPMLKSVTAAPTAIASITAESDTQKKVDYLNDRARKVFSDIERTFRQMFHLNSSSQPRYYKELIDAIKNGEYTIDEKAAKDADEKWQDHVEYPDEYWHDYNAFYGIDFTKFPKPDYRGREKALEELRAEYQRVQDAIAIFPAEEALKAVQDFEKWLPSNAPKKQ